MNSKKIFLTVSLLATISLFISSCYKDKEQLLYGTKASDCSNPEAQGPKFAAVELLIQSKCLDCHSPAGDGTSPDLSTSCDILSNYEGIYNDCVVTKTMPQGSTFTAAQILIIKDWYDAGHKLTD